MRRGVAKAIHTSTNMCFWMENPKWSSGNAAFDLVCSAMQKLPFSPHEAQKRAFFDTSRLLAVNGETVVAVNAADPDKVDKFMLRYPSGVALGAFEQSARHEIGAVTTYLAGIALPTAVSIQPVDILRHTRKLPLAVKQHQQRLDLAEHATLDLVALTAEPDSRQRYRTAKDLEILCVGAEKLRTEFGYIPDVTYHSGNLRRRAADGAVTLIDVMPFYENGSRLIGDRPPDVVSHLQANLALYQEFAGTYGS
ncbi:hypothetical protein EYC58_00150 [Candidatus Saccharibacteria bacterium]|nr:MAG: hypothetical protein EYC58_00150 [Candidatus Saccharibacteria bacterium]